MVVIYRLSLLLGMSVLWSGTVLEAADAVQVQFDCGPAIVCRDVTPTDFSLSNPNEKIIEATLQISTRVTQGLAPDLRELIYEIESPHARVFDFTPRTPVGQRVCGADPDREDKWKKSHDRGNRQWHDGGPDSFAGECKSGRQPRHPRAK